MKRDQKQEKHVETSSRNYYCRSFTDLETNAFSYITSLCRVITDMPRTINPSTHLLSLDPLLSITLFRNVFVDRTYAENWSITLSTSVNPKKIMLTKHFFIRTMVNGIKMDTMCYFINIKISQNLKPIKIFLFL